MIPGVLRLKIPSAYKFLKAAVQNGEPIMWLAVDPNSQEIEERFLLAWTGDDIDGAFAKDYLDTFETPDGLVWHLFNFRP